MSFESQDLDTGDDDRKRDSSRKRDGKRDKREKGYQVFEAEDSDDEPLALAEDLKSPSKQKKEKAKPTFKFPVAVRKEKNKEKEDRKEKEAKLEEKEKKKEEKEKKKHKKDKKKSKHGHQDSSPATAAQSVMENPIFGVPLTVAVERNKSHDGIELPALVRECIDYIEEYGLACEGIYRMSGVKSKVQHLKDCYNRQESVHLLEHEPNVIASLLKLFLRELPEPVLTTSLMPKFEEASTIKNNKKKVEAFTRVIADLPTPNRLLLSWMIVHMTHVIDLAKKNKMSLQNVSIVLSPTMQISHRVLNVLFSNASELFGDVQLRRYVPPLKPAHSKWCLELPDNLTALEEELAKQESLLNQLHAELHSGREDPVISDKLWEVQRVVTQLKRKIKMGKKNVELVERRRTNMDTKRSSTSSLPSLSAPEELQLDLRPAPAVSAVTTTVDVERLPTEEVQKTDRSSKKLDDVKESSENLGGSKERGTDEPEGLTKSDAGTEAASGDSVKPGEDEENEVADRKSEGASDPKKEVTFTEANESAQRSSVVDTTVIEKEEAKVNTESAEENKVALDGDQEAGVAGASSSKESEKKKIDEDSVQTVDTSGKDEASQEVEIRQTSTHDSAGSKLRDSVESKQSEGEKTIQKEKKFDQEDRIATIEKGEVIEGPPTPTSTTASLELKNSSDVLLTDKQSVKDTVQFSEKQEDTFEKLQTSPRQAKETTAKKIQFGPSTVVQDSTPTPKIYEYRKPPNPPFVSTSLLKPMKAEPPKPRLVAEEVERESPQQEMERWRALEEELLGRDDEEEVEVEQILEEEYALKLEEEELLAIADELRQKIATERSEMERLSQEIQELQYLRQDSDLEDLSSASSSSSDSEDEEDLQELLSQLIQDNEELEIDSADLCQKIHDERMICLSVKLQIRLLQQKQLESSCS